MATWIQQPTRDTILRVMRIRKQVGDNYDSTGDWSEHEARWGIPSGCLQPLAAAPSVFPSNWGELSDAIGHVRTHYYFVGGTGVNIGVLVPEWLFESDGHNMLFLPGLHIPGDTFVSKSAEIPVERLIHEGLDDFYWEHTGHITTIVPIAKKGMPVPPKAWDTYFTFLCRHIYQGTNAWQYIRRDAGWY